MFSESPFSFFLSFFLSFFPSTRGGALHPTMIMPEEEDEFDVRATVFERRLTLATEEMMQQTHLAFPSNGNSNDFSGEAETTTTTTTTTTTATEE